jgi:hypothetical protein
MRECHGNRVIIVEAEILGAPFKSAPSAAWPSATRVAGSANGKGRSRTPSMMEKMTAMGPIPNASLSTAVRVNPATCGNGAKRA